MSLEVSMEDLGNEEDWELVNDDGFVYRRKKIHHLDSISSAPPPDPAVEEKNRRRRKKQLLLKIKERYLNEIHKWENLSNNLDHMRLKANEQSEQLSTSVTDTVLRPVVSSDSAAGGVVDDLLDQAMADEAIVRDVSRICDIADSLISADEERVYQYMIDLPIWGSPRHLISSLSDD